ncbi:MAG: hypothetical protein EHM20_00240 [Alphaproteobacteria bacterium]|nr:MAG: hypothetical protein EHM20_00240 [Alphaproteobacteria bacterium]
MAIRKFKKELSKTTKILELVRALQKEAEAYQNDFGGDESVDDFCNTICYYCSEVRDVINDD